MVDLVRTAGMTGFRRTVSQLHGNPAALLKNAGLTNAQLDDPDCFIRYSQLIVLLEHSARVLDCPDLGLRLCHFQNLNILGFLGQLIHRASDARRGFLAAARNMHLHVPSAQIQYVDRHSGKNDKLTFSIDLLPLPAAAQTFEMSIGLIAAIARRLTGDKSVVRTIGFQHQAMSCDAIYQKRLGLVPFFGAPSNYVLFDRRKMEQPIFTVIAQGGGVTPSFSEFREANQFAPLKEQTQQLTHQLFRNGPVHLSMIADMLGIHERKLQRILRAEGSSFQEIIDEVRKTFVLKLLAQPYIPLSHVAQLANCADQSVLTRNCRRWFGMTPRQYRIGLTA